MIRLTIRPMVDIGRVDHARWPLHDAASFAAAFTAGQTGEYVRLYVGSAVRDPVGLSPAAQHVLGASVSHASVAAAAVHERAKRDESAAIRQPPARFQNREPGGERTFLC